MSKLSDYSKFDHLVDSDAEEEESGAQAPPSAIPLQQKGPQMQTTSTEAQTRRDDKTGRYIFEYNGQKIYEWEQSLEDVNVYIDEPPGVNGKASMFDIQIGNKHLKVGLKGHNRYFLDEDTFGSVDTTESSWYLDDGVLNIVLTKVQRGSTWESVLVGREDVVDPFTKQSIQKDLMLERFQEENPGMDFRGATFNGVVPDPRTFMGGIGYR